MRRRRFLKLAAAGAAGAGLAPYVQAAKFKPHPCDVVVIGAGMAGVSAASRIRAVAPQLRVVVLEARSRTGGRLHTAFAPGSKPMELGASWIHDADVSPLTPLAQSFGLTLVDTPYTDLVMRQDGARLDLPEVADALATFGDQDVSMRAYRVQRQAALQPDTSIQTAVDVAMVAQNPPFSAQELRYLACLNRQVNALGEGADLNQVSLYSWGEDDNQLITNSLVLPSYPTLVTKLVQQANLDIRLGYAAQSIDYSGSTVSVLTTRGLFTAPQVVVTLPTAVLNASSVTFTPGLPANKLSALGRLGRGFLNKIYLGFPTSFWDPDATFIARVPTSAAASNWVPWLNVGKFLNAHILMSFNMGPFAADLDAMPEATAVAAAMTELRGMFGNGIPDPLFHAISHWSTDPYAQAAITYLKPGGTPTDYDTMKGTVANKLYFAGDGTSSLHPRSVRGAYETGQDAANAILSARGLLVTTTSKGGKKK